SLPGGPILRLPLFVWKLIVQPSSPFPIHFCFGVLERFFQLLGASPQLVAFFAHIRILSRSGRAGGQLPQISGHFACGHLAVGSSKQERDTHALSLPSVSE